MIIDSHLHLPWEIKGKSEKKKELLKKMECNSVEKGVVIADSELESVICSVQECAELFRDSDSIKVIAGISPIISFNEQLELCRELLASRDIAGLKVYTGHEAFYCDDPALVPVYDLAEEYRVPVLLHTGWDNSRYAAPERMSRLAAERPQNTFVYCHCFYPDTEHCFEVLRDHRNVIFDISSLADDEKLVPQIKSSLEKAIALMPDRFIYGSDYGSCSMEAHIRFAESLDITACQRGLFMHGNSERVYGF